MPEERKSINEHDLWTRQGPLILYADEYIGLPNFYPVYRAGKAYSWSLLALVRELSTVKLNPKAMGIVSNPAFGYLPPHIPPFLNIERIGGPLVMASPRICSSRDFAEAIAKAMCDDIALVEEANPGFENVVLVGGRDSMNLLLAKWQSPITVASSPPNSSLVREFIKRNGLDVKFIELDEFKDEALDDEILINCFRMGLQDARWGGQLRTIAKAMGEKVIFWKGQLADTFLTPYWQTYRSTIFERKIYRWANLIHFKLLDRSHLYQQSLCFETHWNRGAMWQGVHTAIVRELTDCLTLSGYHGREVISVLQHSDLAECVKEDLRPAIGRLLAGREVWYPSHNPGPAQWRWRAIANSIGSWVKAAEWEGIHCER